MHCVHLTTLLWSRPIYKGNAPLVRRTGVCSGNVYCDPEEPTPPSQLKGPAHPANVFKSSDDPQSTHVMDEADTLIASYSQRRAGAGEILILDRDAPLGDDWEPRSNGERFLDAERGEAYAASGNEFCVYGHGLYAIMGMARRSTPPAIPGGNERAYYTSWKDRRQAYLSLGPSCEMRRFKKGAELQHLEGTLFVYCEDARHAFRRGELTHPLLKFRRRPTHTVSQIPRLEAANNAPRRPSCKSPTTIDLLPAQPYSGTPYITATPDHRTTPQRGVSTHSQPASFLVRQASYAEWKGHYLSNKELVVLEGGSSELQRGEVHNRVDEELVLLRGVIPRTKEMHLNIYIALYNTEGGDGKYHWALVTRDPQHKLSEPVCEYQVVKKKKWETQHSSGARLGAPLLCLIEMPSLEATAKEVDAFIRQQPAGQGSSTLLRGQKGWSSAHWVIRTLDGMAEPPRRWFEESVGDQTDFYDYIACVKGRNCEQGVAAGPEFAHAYGAHVGVEVDGIRVLDTMLEEKEAITKAVRRHLEFRLKRRGEKHAAIDKVLVEQHLCDARREWMEVVGRQRKIVWDWKTEKDIKKRLGLTREDMLKNRVGAPVKTVKVSSAAIDAARTSACMVSPRPPPPKFVPGVLPDLPTMILVVPDPIAMFSCSPRTMRGHFEKATELALGYQVEYCGFNRTKARQKAEGRFLESMKELGFEAPVKAPEDEDWETNAKRRLNETYRKMVREQEKKLAGVEDRERVLAEFKRQAMTSLKQTLEEERSRRVAVQQRA
ncbi:hypothetical protein EDD18DRAFT_1334970 [Armillaria luteobubalina]|uniref:Uncharacterized protein n=1 Tax=Armillaria luteobubalina TaxID=153913 RepID=A0AA39PS32_9AGAR|nr:hypothetical protein EDD18DRAFT_1334970 [Armillaria luteobubalina]